MGAGNSVFGGASTTVTPVTAPQSKSFHNHSDTAINSLAKNGGLMGVGKKIASTFAGAGSSGGASNTSTLDSGL